MTIEEHRKLRQAIGEITEIAKGFGLDFYTMRYEICPADIIYTFGVYGMPTRYTHWSFGKAFHRTKMQYDLGLSKIYELVINSDPCYAFLLEGNSLIQNKLIVAHVLAHSDFFKNNARFAHTNRKMVESMAASAERIRRYEIRYGRKNVEAIIDAGLAIQEHIDPKTWLVKRDWDEEDHANNRNHKQGFKGSQSSHRSQGTRGSQGMYDDLWELENERETIEIQAQTDQSGRRQFPPEPEKDMLLFIQEYSSNLLPWQRDILTILRDEMLYFWPQLETKIMNEGWATYWHQMIMRELELDEMETIEYAKLNANVIQPSQVHINPYYLGLEIYKDIEKRWDEPTEEEQKRYGRKPGQGRAKLFEVRELESDTSFLRNYLTKELVDELDLYIFARQGNNWTIVDKNWETVRDQLINARINGGHPYLVVEDGDYNRNGELLIIHRYEGTELDIKYLEKTLPHVFVLWGKTVHLRTTVEGRDVQFSYDGKKTMRKFL